MRPSIFVLLAAGCGGLASHSPATLPTGTHEHESTEVHYRLWTLEVPSEADVDGDGVVDNHLVDTLAGLDVLLPEQGFALDEFNTTLTDNLAKWSAVQLEAHIHEEELHLHVTSGTIDEHGDITPAENAVPAQFDGVVEHDGTFVAGPQDFSLAIVALVDTPPVPVTLLETDVEGHLDEHEIHGTFTTLIPVQRVIDDVLAPIIPDDGWDIDLDGVPESAGEILAFVESLAPTLGDVTLDDGSPAITATLSFEGEADAELEHTEEEHEE